MTRNRTQHAKRRLRRIVARSSDYLYAGRWQAYARVCERLERIIGGYQAIPAVQDYRPAALRALGAVR